jgi:hypothetical protein
MALLNAPRIQDAPSQARAAWSACVRVELLKKGACISHFASNVWSAADCRSLPPLEPLGVGQRGRHQRRHVTPLRPRAPKQSHASANLSNQWC